MWQASGEFRRDQLPTDQPDPRRMNYSEGRDASPPVTWHDLIGATMRSAIASETFIE